jgi:hypothetical protein
LCANSSGGGYELQPRAADSDRNRARRQIEHPRGDVATGRVHNGDTNLSLLKQVPAGTIRRAQRTTSV